MITYDNGQICHLYSGHYFEPLYFKFLKLNFPNSLHLIQEHMKENNFGQDHHVKFILDQILCSSKVGTFYQMQQSHFIQICNSLILKIPPPLVFVSGHLQPIQMNHFQILEPPELNQFWQSLQFSNMEQIQNTIWHSVGLTPSAHSTLPCPLVPSISIKPNSNLGGEPHMASPNHAGHGHATSLPLYSLNPSTSNLAP